MSTRPEGLLFSRDHMWAAVSGGVAQVGLTDFAQESLGDIVDVSLPDANDRVTAGQACGDIESTKSVSDLVAPVSGTVTAVNRELGEHPELINTEPYGSGWLMEIRIDAGTGTGDLLSADDYKQLIGH
ncbi:MAG: glycine cleavage system protein GcvH [Actinomycetota bacterium]|nr:glycine cleavage system protein GcvH [Actinomycetota bacterium]